MRLEIARGYVYKRKTKFIVGGVLEVVCESESGFVERKSWMGKKANRANRSEMLKGRLRAPLLNLEFQEKCIEPIFELQHSILIKRSDNKCVQERPASVRERGFPRFGSRGRKVKCTWWDAGWPRNNFAEWTLR